MNETLRQRLTRLLQEREHDFDELRSALQIPVRDLEEALEHVGRSVRHRGQRLRATDPSCLDCGFDFAGRSRKRLHPPGRCPECRGGRIAPPRFRVD